MSEDPLERELKGIRPREPSSDLRRRIAEQLADFPQPAGRRDWRWRVLLAAAACLAGLYLLGRDPTTPVRNIEERPSLQAGAVVPPPATLQAYHRAFAESPEALEGLLALHASIPPGTDQPAREVSAFSRIDSDLLISIGVP